ncbi:DNA-3-methyladenine glycosylase 2 family protein [Leptospira sp. FAT2]|uniref:DNA-3-methyladenine glycosylase family protein n=1 Tax=Leptospira sanjuanensis TaxID=2879643 RepID=UPI001EE8E6E9|nr:DNA-3-methyladenine glycosylase 2 family protein [Leptospira sanjuanensis]MCG6192541.1 DNA-3-methyladenine glycosylase 2 family protein [Leptospira sanjuanensis]
MKRKIQSFDRENFHSICDRLSKKDKELHSILVKYGYPPFWSRKPGFETLVHIILEQQVSLASAKAAMNKLKQKIGTVTPKKISLLSDMELKECYFSRQKMAYARHLAHAILSKRLALRKLTLKSDEEIRKELVSVKGIGNWTADVFLLMALHRSDIFPVGDLAMIQSLKKVKKLPVHVTQERILSLAETWRPFRSIAAMILWHSYIQEKGIKI